MGVATAADVPLRLFAQGTGTTDAGTGHAVLPPGESQGDAGGPAPNTYGEVTGGARGQQLHCMGRHALRSRSPGSHRILRSTR